MSELGPITAELRAALDVDREFMRADGTVVAQTFCVDRGDFERLCDAIDAVHAGLERENAELRQRVAVLDNERGNMHDGGSITGELRKWAKGSTLSSWTAEHLTAIADHIDAEHQKALDEWKAKDGQTWLRGYGECHAELMEGNEVIAASLEEAGWVRLPVDADGVPIHIGDVMEWPTTHETFEVVGIGDGTLFYIEDGRERADWTGASTKSHHHAPTVEDVLREFADEMNQNLGMYTGEAIDADEWRDADNKTVEKYAKRLTLAGDAE